MMEKKKNQTFSEVIIALANRLDLSSMDCTAALSTILETVVHAFNVDQVSIWQFNDIQPKIQCTNILNTSISSPKSNTIIDLTFSRAYLVALHAEGVIVSENITADSQLVDLPQTFWVDPRIRSCVHVPIRVVNQVTAILRIDSRAERKWTSEEVSGAVRAADLVGQVLMTCDLITRNNRSDSLIVFTSDLTHRYELTTMLEDIVRKSVTMLKATYGSLYFTDSVRKTLTTIAGYNVPLEKYSQTLRYGEYAAGKVAETGNRLLIKDYRVWPGRTEELKKNELLTTILSVPLETRGEMLGVLQVTRTNSDLSFTDSDLDVLSGYASLACLAIEKSHLVDTNKRLVQFQDSMKNIFETTSYASSTMDFMETTTDFLAYAFSTSMIAIGIKDESALRGFSANIHEQIENVLMKRGRRFNPVTIVNDITQMDIADRAMLEVMQRQKVQSYILAPIQVDRDRIGYLLVASKLARTWAAEDSQMMEIAANQLGLVYEGMKYFQESRTKIDLLQHMTDVTSSLNCLLSLEDMIPVIGNGVTRLMNADAHALILREQDDIVRASWASAPARTELNKVINNEGKEFLKTIATIDKPIFVTDVRSSILPKQFKNYILSTGMKAVKIVPIEFSGNTIGAIIGFHSRVVDWLMNDRQLILTYANTVALALQNTWSYEQLEKGYMDLAVSLAGAIDSREGQAKAASIRMAEWAERTAQLLGMSHDAQNILRWAAMLHDIGKVDVPDDVIQKNGPLTSDEKQKLQQYPVKSEKLVKPLSGYGDVGSVLRGLREHYDGTGYPDKRKGDDIPMGSRILSVADAYMSMLENRPYRSALTREAAIEEIKKNSGKQFDPQVVDAFLQVIELEPAKIK